MELENNELLINLLNKKRLDKYLLFTNDNVDKAIKLHDLNLKLGESLHTPLAYFEIFLRNTCNDKLKKELGDYWFDNKKVMGGNNHNEDKKAIEKIEKTRKDITQDKKRQGILNYIPTNSDIISNLQLGFWTHLFCSDYKNNVWYPYLRHVFDGFTRKELFKFLETTRILRNRIFHYEPIIFDKQLEQKYTDIIDFIYFMSNDDICIHIKNISNFSDLYKEIKNLGAPIN